MQSQGSASGRVHIFSHQGCLLRGLIELLQLISANRPGLEIARWQIRSGTDELILEVFQEQPEGSGLLDSIVLSVVLLRSGYSFGTDYEDQLQDDPFYFLCNLTGLARHGL